MLPQNKRVCLKFSKATCLKRNAGWGTVYGEAGRGVLVPQSGAKRWERGGGSSIQGQGLIWATFSPHPPTSSDPSTLHALPLVSAPDQDPLHNEVSKLAPLSSLHPWKPSPTPTPAVPLPPASGTLLLATPFHCTHCLPVSTPHLDVPSSQTGAQEKKGRRLLSGSWEKADEAAGPG